MSGVRPPARRAASSRTVQLAARAGYAANGIVHIMVGAVVLVVAFGGQGESDQTGAFKAVAATRLGLVALWIIALAFGALGVWHILDGVLARRESATAKWGERASKWSQAAVFLALGGLAASVALGARPNADETAQDVSVGVLALPGGVFVLGIASAGILVGGVVFIVMGTRRSFERRITIPSGGIGRIVVVLGVIGFIAKGIALGIVGILLLVAALRVDPSAAGSLDAAIAALRKTPSGPWLTGAVGAGLIVYGVFCIFRARYARL